MNRCFAARLVLIFSVLFLVGSVAKSNAADGIERTYLHKNWQIQSSCQAVDPGEQISKAGYDASSWHKAEIPATVVGALVTDKTYPDPAYAKNLKSLPGMDYGDKTFFANADLPAGSPFKCSWWYRTEFALPAGGEQKNEWLNFLGINYRANIWVNGLKVADRAEVAGTYRRYEFNISKALKAGKNALAVEVFAPEKDDLGITWVDWNPTPADKSMGLWKEVFLTTSGPVTTRDTFVTSKLGADYKTAELSISTVLKNTSDKEVKGVLRGEVEGIELQQPVTLAAGEAQTARFTAERFPKLKFAHARLWWPYSMGKPELYTAKVLLEIGQQVSDSQKVTFGIREVAADLTEKGHLLFKVNGRKLLIRGAAWAPDMFYRWSSSRLDADLAYVRDMGLNTIRLEGRLDRDEFFEKTDKLGILVMPGWTCCDAWERWDRWKGDQSRVAAASLRDQITRLRIHASVFVWLNGSDGPPPADVEQMYLDIEHELGWPNPILSSASDTATTVTGNSGVKMTGPYEYVPPMYWLVDTEAGGAYGYNTETSPGPAIPTRESLERFIPKEHLWPIDDFWNYHAGGERFTTVNVFTEGLTKRYGEATSLDDYERKAQAMTYDGERAMFEAYGRNKYTSTGVIQWMLNNSWPSLIWHLYDYYLVPAGGYFGTKKALEPVHVQYSYDENSVAVVNSTYEPLSGLKVSARIYNVDATEKASKETTIDLAADGLAKAFDLPKPDGLSTTYFLKLKLQNASGKVLSDNFYWLSTKSDVMDWKGRKDTAYTPQSEFADLTGLNALPQVAVQAMASTNSSGGRGITLVAVGNPSKNIAFMVHVRVTRGRGGAEVTPVLWTDNYFSLLPGERRTVLATYEEKELGGKPAEIRVDGYNVSPVSVVSTTGK